MKFLVSSSIFISIIIALLSSTKNQVQCAAIYSNNNNESLLNPLDHLEKNNRQKRSEDEEHFSDADFDEPAVEVIDDPEMLAGLQNDKAQMWFYVLAVVGVVVLGVGGYFGYKLCSEKW